MQTTDEEAEMEFIVLGGITFVALVAWSMCLTRVSCPFRRDNREPEDS
jgi:hypothetical protein